MCLSNIWKNLSSKHTCSKQARNKVKRRIQRGNRGSVNEETARGQLTTRSANDAFYRVPRGSGIGAMRIIASVEENIVRGHATDKKGPTRKLGRGAERIPNARESASTRILPGFLLLINSRVRFVGNFIAFLTTGFSYSYFIETKENYFDRRRRQEDRFLTIMLTDRASLVLTRNAFNDSRLVMTTVLVNLWDLISSRNNRFFRAYRWRSGFTIWNFGIVRNFCDIASLSLQIIFKAKRETPSRPHKGYNLANARMVPRWG